MGFQHYTLFGFVTLMVAHTLPMQVHGKSLNEELKDFCNIIPSDRMDQIAEEHIRTDTNFNEAVIFLQSHAWANMLEDVEQNFEWRKLKKHLEQLGLNLDNSFKSFLKFLTSLHPIPNEKETARSLRSFFDDVELILPIGKLLAMLHEKKQKSTAFQEFYTQLSSHEVYQMFENVRKQPEVKRIWRELRLMGARLDDILELFYGFMNWDAPMTESKREAIEEKIILLQEFDEFVKLVPWNILKNISDKHLANDKEFGEAITFFQSNEFAEMLESIKIQPEYIELKKYLTDIGFEIEKILAFFYHLSMKAVPKTKVSGNAKENSLRPYLDEIDAALPIAELYLLLENKMEYSGEFNRFVKKLSDEKVKIMIEKVNRLPESVKLFQTLQKLGLKIKEVFMFIYSYLGWGAPFHIF